MEPGLGQEGVRLVPVGVCHVLPFPGGNGEILFQERHPLMRQLPVGVGGFPLRESYRLRRASDSCRPGNGSGQPGYQERERDDRDRAPLYGIGPADGAAPPIYMEQRGERGERRGYKRKGRPVSPSVHACGGESGHGEDAYRIQAAQNEGREQPGNAGGGICGAIRIPWRDSERLL